jgi:integrase
MATYFHRKNRDGSRSILTLVRVKGFRPASRSFATKVEAKAWAEPLERALKGQRKRGGVRADVATLTIRKLVGEYLADPKVKALKSYESYHDLLDWWVAGYGADKLVDFGVLTLREARERLAVGGRRKARAAGTVNRHLSAMRSVWNWGRTAGLIPLERAWPSKLLLPEPSGRKVFLTDEQLATLLNAAVPDPVMHAAIVLSVATGLRQGELLRLRWSDIDLDGNKLVILQTKNATPRGVYVAPAAVTALRTLKHAKVVSTATVFLASRGQPMKKSTLESRWDRIRDAAGLTDFRWHDLRHSCASFLAQNGSTLLEIGARLGHKSPSMTMRYAHLVQGAPVAGDAALDDLLKGGTS